MFKFIKKCIKKDQSRGRVNDRRYYKISYLMQLNSTKGGRLIQTEWR